MRKTNLCVVAFVAAMAIVVTFLCVVCNDGGVKSGGGDAVAFLNKFSEESVYKGDDGSGSGTFTDARDGKTYKKVKIGEQTWMAENLNYATSSGSWCYDNSADSCAKYGRLYDWVTAMGLDASYNDKVWGGRDVASKKVCPAGWRLPSTEDWQELMWNFCQPGYGCDLVKLKVDYGWKKDDHGIGMDVYGFSALPGGYGYVENNGVYFRNAGESGSWWSTQDAIDSVGYVDVIVYAGCFNLGSIVDEAEGVGMSTTKRIWFSVRCIRGN